MRNLVHATLTLALVQGSALLAQETSFQAVTTQLEALLETHVSEDAVGGISAGVVFGDSVVWAKGFGWANRETQEPADDSTVYRVGSISKSVTATMMMVLVQDGLLDVDDQVARYLPAITELPGYPTEDPLTFRDLATHTGGLVREPTMRGAADGPMDRWEEKILASIPLTPVTTDPGTQYSYSNIGYGIMGLAVSRAAGQPFMVLVTERFFRPLGMTTAGFRPAPNLERHLAAGYSVSRDGTIDGETPAREHGGRGYKVPNGAVYANVYDLAKFIGAIVGVRDYLTEANLDEMLRIQTPESEQNGYGLGFNIVIDEAGNRIAGHGGSVAGYNASMQFDPDAQIGVVLMRNYGRGRTNLGRVARETVIALREARVGR